MTSREDTTSRYKTLPRVLLRLFHKKTLTRVYRGELRKLASCSVLCLVSCKPGYTMNRKRKGTRNEHRSMAVLEAAGYRCTRSAASLGEWDIVAINSRDVVLVQVKTRDWPGSVEMEQLREFPVPPNCRKIVHRWRHRQRLPVLVPR